MTDLELLDLAAKSIGEWDYKYDCYSGTPVWNPLMNNSDAFVLMIKLGMRVTTIVYNGQPIGVLVTNNHGECGVSIDSHDDLYSATRCAITNVAAQVGANDKPTWS